MKKCPYCAEEIQEEAIKCKHCKSDLVEITPSTVQEDAPKEVVIRCPRCGSTQLSANKQGYKVGRAVGVGLLTFGIGGLVAGAIGASNVHITCLKCGHRWKAGK